MVALQKGDIGVLVILSQAGSFTGTGVVNSDLGNLVILEGTEEQSDNGRPDDKQRGLVG